MPQCNSLPSRFLWDGGTLARAEAGHQEPKGDLYGEEFHHEDAVAASFPRRLQMSDGRVVADDLS